MISLPPWYGGFMFCLGFAAFPLTLTALRFILWRWWGMERNNNEDERLEQARFLARSFAVDVRRLLIDPQWHDQIGAHVELYLDHLSDLDAQLHPSRPNPYLCFHDDMPAPGVPHQLGYMVVGILPENSTLLLVHPITPDDDDPDDDTLEVDRK